MPDNRPLKRSSTSSGLEEIVPISVSTGAPDASKLVQTNAAGKLDESLLNIDPVQTMTASENLSARAMVNVHDSTGPKIRNADAASAIPCDGFIESAILSAASGNVEFARGNIVSGFAGLTVAATYFLDPAVPGGIITPIPAYTPGQIQQVIGKALSATELLFAPEAPILIA